MSIPYKSFYFMRHGETLWNIKNKLMGQVDIPMNEQGVHQSYIAGKIMQKIPFDHIICSPLMRTLKTAEIIASITNKPIIKSNEFSGCNWGAFAGKKPSLTWYQAWVGGSQNPGGESYEQLKTRIIEGLKKALMIPGLPLILGHGGGYSIIQKELSLPNIGHIPTCRPIFHSPPAQKGLWWSSKIVD